jgi:hypothetical protein
LVRYQQQMTDKMAALLDVGSPDAWQRFCRRIAPRTLHSQLGRRLAFLYATERYYLFELLLPEDFADPGEDYGLSSIVSTPDRFIAEANAVLKDVDCLSGVPDFVSAAQRRSEDLLAQPDEFDRHRERLLQLQEWLKRNAPT